MVLIMWVKLIKDYATTQLFANRHIAETPMDRIVRAVVNLKAKNQLC